MHVVGTAGHIDHGKSTLVRALAGTDPDRLDEEKSRGMTIDLGFAWVPLPSGREVGMIDVPGHQKFIKNMLAGAGNIDLSLFIVAANDGWMPQSEEHLAILDLLGVRRGVVVLTKKDLVDDDWLELVKEEVADRVAGRALADAPVVAVSSTTGEGLDELRRELDTLLDEAPAPRDLGRPHLWIDRAFSVKGAGTVVTGTLADGSLRLDDEVRLLPGSKRARVRGLQSHKRAVDRIEPGHRAAVNLSGVDAAETARGRLLIAAGDAASCRETERVHALLTFPAGGRVGPGEERFVKVYAGTAEVNGRLKLLEPPNPVSEEGGSATAPGARRTGFDALAQIEFDRPLPLRLRDPIIVRDPSTQQTLGGGTVADPAAPAVRGRRLRVARSGGGTLDVERLRAWAEAPPERLPELLLESRKHVTDAELRSSLPLPPEDLDDVLTGLQASGGAVRFTSFWMGEVAWRAWSEGVRRLLRAHHEQHPLRVGLPKETLRTALGEQTRLFDEAIAFGEGRGLWESDGAYVRLPDHRVSFAADEEEAYEQLRALMERDRFAPPTRTELVDVHGYSQELLAALLEQRRLVKVSRDVLLTDAAFEAAKRLLLSHIAENGSVDVAAARDLLDTSRKYALPLLEHLDEVGVTRRVGDRRVAGPRAGDPAV